MKGIPMKTWEVCAILDNRKTVTRRVVKPQPIERPTLKMCQDDVWRLEWWDVNEFHSIKVPICIGDILYVRETWAKPYNGMYRYRADYNEHDIVPADRGDVSVSANLIKWLPSIHMPREAARIFLRVTDVRVERLREIAVGGILAEGMDTEIPPICKQSIDPNFPSDEQRAQLEKMSEAQREEYVKNRARHTYIGWCDYVDRLFGAFIRLWNGTLKPADRALYGWEDNPWVRVIEFERISKEEAQP